MCVFQGLCKEEALCVIFILGGIQRQALLVKLRVELARVGVAVMGVLW